MVTAAGERETPIVFEKETFVSLLREETSIKFDIALPVSNHLLALSRLAITTLQVFEQQEITAFL